MLASGMGLCIVTQVHTEVIQDTGETVTVKLSRMKDFHLPPIVLSPSWDQMAFSHTYS